MRIRILVLLLGLATLPGLLAAAPWSNLSRQPDAWFSTADGQRIVAHVLSWQSPHGSWPKNMDTTAKPRPETKASEGTFDNGATTDELRFLARAFRVTRDPRCEAAVLKGLDHILQAQYPTGGWPQSYPPGKGYPRHITFNDGTMVRLMNFIREVANSPAFAFVDNRRKDALRAAFDRGVTCILQCQVVVDGRKTVWCAQHDEITLEPRPARSYELVSLSGAESAGVLEFLMSLESPNPAVVAAVDAGVEWFASAGIHGIRVVRVDGDRQVQAAPDAPPLWARFYEIGSNRPMFCGRDGIKKYSLAEIERERRTGYSWYGDWGKQVADRHARWKAAHSPRRAGS